GLCGASSRRGGSQGRPAAVARALDVLPDPGLDGHGHLTVMVVAATILASLCHLAVHAGECTMPLYEYKCADCERPFELLVASPALADSVACRYCGSRFVRRLISAFASRSSREPV